MMLRLLACGILILYTRLLNAQIGCPVPMTCNDPVPAVDVATVTFYNSWVDTQGDEWLLLSNGNTVSGFVFVIMPSGCPIVSFTVNGTITPSNQLDGLPGYTDFSWRGTNPQPANTCGGVTPIPSTYTGRIQNKGNDYSSPTTWVNDDGVRGTTVLTKQPADKPASETTQAVGFGSSGIYMTIGQFRQTLNPTVANPDIFKGRQVFETTGFGSPHYDNCWQSWSAYAKWQYVDGSIWNVGYYPVNPPWTTSLNQWVDDYIGYPANLVDYYRTHYHGTGVLCGARIPQAMLIRTNSNGFVNYTDDIVGADIYTSSVTTYRAGVSQSVNR